MRILRIDNLIVSCLKYRLVFQILGEWKIYLLELYQNDYSKYFVVFNSLEDGKDFVSQIPGYTLETEDGFEVEYVNPKHLLDYMEIIYNGNIVPLSRFSFNPEENVIIDWKEILNLSVKNDICW